LLREAAVDLTSRSADRQSWSLAEAAEMRWAGIIEDLGWACAIALIVTIGLKYVVAVL
jgi:hypothetical protein